MTIPHSPPLLLALDDERARNPALAGGKASSLAALVAGGAPVPPGLVLTTAAFAGSADGSALAPEARDQLVAALADLAGPFAVRSSGVAEDLAGASFAGLYETVLEVSGVDAVLDAVRRCAASAQAPRVVAYRRERGVAAAPMAVLVQRMVQPRAAGVAFTAHTVTGEREVVVISATAGLGEKLVSGDVDAEEWEVRDAPRRLRGPAAVLSAADAAAVAALAREVAGGAPTDVEWAITGDEASPTLHLLQARPMTALPEPVRWDAPCPGGFVRNFRLGEWLGAPMTPLCATLVIETLERRAHARFEELSGVTMPEPGHVVVNGWYFYGGLNIEMTPWALIKALPTMVRILLSPRRAELLAATPPVAHLGFAAEERRWRDVLLPALRATVADASTRVATASPAEHLALVEAVLAQTAEQVGSIVGVAGYAAKCEGKLFELIRAYAPGFDGSAIDLVAGAPCVAAEHDVEGLDPVFPTLGERGALPPPPDEATRARVLARRDAAEARLLAATPAKRHGVFAAAIAEARRAHAVRLEQTGLMTLGWPVLRRALLALGAHAHQAGVLDRADDVFFLTRDELVAVTGGARERVDTAPRRQLWERQRKLAPPLVIGELIGMGKEVFGMIDALLRHPEHAEPDALVGMPGSPGRVTGPARVVRSVDELHRLAPGEILVAPVTTPAWTLAFSRAAAIVTDSGSVASHASIVAREHGIPAVVATGQGTARIVDGQIITVDGGRGVVRLGTPR